MIESGLIVVCIWQSSLRKSGDDRILAGLV